MTINYHPLPSGREVFMSWEIHELEGGLLEVLRHENGIPRRVGTAQLREFAWGIANADRAYMRDEAERLGVYIRESAPLKQTVRKTRRHRWFRP